MQEEESMMVVRRELKIPSLQPVKWITVRHYEASQTACDRIFDPHLTTIKYSIFYAITGSGRSGEKPPVTGYQRPGRTQERNEPLTEENTHGYG